MTEVRRSGAKGHYDERRPVLSVRLSDEQKKKVEEMARISGTSVGGFVREGLGLEVKERGKAYREGYKKGREEAMRECLVTVMCTCGKGFPVKGEDRVREAEEILARYCNWYHRGCRPPEVPDAECRLFKDPRHVKGLTKGA
ncbi:MAG: hypothetical protein AB7S97_02035 [Thermoplasmata archaeon]